jgi:uncharacterized LabA/DUF88 family protein
VADRAAVFIDGNNWYHGLRDRLRLPRLLDLDYSAISKKLLGPREWTCSRYYVGQVQQRGRTSLYTDQRRFLRRVTDADIRISYHLGRLEHRTVTNEAARELRNYLTESRANCDPRVFRDLLALTARHFKVTVMVEKAVDVHLAVDMVMMAQWDEYDVAYLLSADGDFTPAVKAVRGIGKKVFAASPLYGARLAAVVNSYIRLNAAWFTDCYRTIG